MGLTLEKLPKKNGLGDLEKELEMLLNKHSVDTMCNTPDFILARYLISSLILYSQTINKRDSWRLGLG